MKIIKTLFVAAFALVAGYSVYSTQQNAEMSDLAKANIEALASGESGDYHITCYNGSGSSFLCECSTCTWQYIGTSSKGKCY